MNKMVDDTQCIAEWRKLLAVFKMIIKDSPEPETVKDQLWKLKEAAKASAHLMFHQVTAITARCDNYMNGEYGNTKTSENFGHTGSKKEAAKQ